MMLEKYQTKVVMAKGQVESERVVTCCLRKEHVGGVDVRVTMRGVSGSVVVRMIENYFRAPGAPIVYAADYYDGDGKHLDGGSSSLDGLFDGGKRVPPPFMLTMSMMGLYREEVLGIYE